LEFLPLFFVLDLGSRAISAAGRAASEVSRVFLGAWKPALAFLFLNMTTTAKTKEREQKGEQKRQKSI